MRTTRRKVNTLKHMAFIMDGNRRWAKKRFLPSAQGHRKGYQKVKEVAEWCIEIGVEVLTVYAFSTENWKRAQKEISYLMDLVRYALRDDLESYMKQGIRIRIIGQRQRLPRDIQELIEEVEEKTKCNTRLVLQIALSYGGRAEIIESMREMYAKISRKEIDIATLDEAIVSSHLWTRGVQDPDLVVRTGGEMRLSNFLIWQSVYSELYFTKTLWPSFTKKEFQEMVEDYYHRKRNFGS